MDNASGIFRRRMVAGRIGAVVALAAALVPHAARAGHQPPADAPPHLENTAPSIDVLIGRFLGALTAKDRRALQRLRVNQREYIDVIMPGSIEPGKERRTFPEDKAQYFWGVLNEKSVYSEIALLNGYGGRKYKVETVTWAKGVKQFDGYTGYAQLRLTVRDEKGDAHEIDTGSVAEIAGRYKFISYVRD